MTGQIPPKRPPARSGNDKTTKAESGGVVAEINLLTLAAAAAGVKIKWAQIAHTGEFFSLGWNPWLDDGDALRMAVAVGLSIEVHFDESQPLPWLRVVYRFQNKFGRNEELWEQVLPDEYNANKAAATRRAIVKAAARAASILQGGAA